jgi:pSer/pThr/pTyr-binding forkhead associated (FHA) protein
MSAHRFTPQELKRRLELERDGNAFIECPGVEGAPALFELPGSGRVTIGRSAESDLTIEGDPEVSRIHAELEQVGGGWVISDDGLSRNGTFIKGTRMVGRKRLYDGDTIGIGKAVMVFRHPAEQDDRTAASTEDPGLEPITDTQRRVLVALCRPFSDGSEFAKPSTNKEIAEEVFLSVEAVKAHLRALFERFGIGDLPQNQKRLKLVENALRSGTVSTRELRDPGS